VIYTGEKCDYCEESEDLVNSINDYYKEQAAKQEFEQWFNRMIDLDHELTEEKYKQQNLQQQPPNQQLQQQPPK
jgi:hypothetical protein